MDTLLAVVISTPLLDIAQVIKHWHIEVTTFSIYDSPSSLCDLTTIRRRCHMDGSIAMDNYNNFFALRFVVARNFNICAELKHSSSSSLTTHHG